MWMLALFLAAALEAQPPLASRCAAAYTAELSRKERDGSLPRPADLDVARLTPEQRETLSKLGPFVTEGRMWMTLAFSRDDAWRAVPYVHRSLVESGGLLASTLAACEQTSAADQRSIPEPPKPAPGEPVQCAAELANIRREIGAQAPAATLIADARSALSRLEAGRLTCTSTDQARQVWMEIGSRAAAAAAKAPPAP
jgi:hypothetical protein